MRQLDALRVTVALVAEVDVNSVMFLPSSMWPDHLRDMLRRAEETKMSPAKLGRWLGWAQASVVAMGVATLDDVKQLNRLYSDGDDP